MTSNRSTFVMGAGLLLSISLSACAQRTDEPVIDRDTLLSHVRTLAADDMEGREAGAPGGEKAREYVLEQLQSTGIHPCGDDFVVPFTFTSRGSDEGVSAANIVGQVEGTGDSDERIVVSAHYDHVGIRNDQVYNGADDNASGTAVLIELARYFEAHPPEHTIVFAAFDAEEKGLRGARAFLETDCAMRAPIALNVNLDMVSRSPVHELYATGTYHYPFLKPILETVAVPDSMTLLFGHDLPGTGSDDWTSASDQGPFHAKGIPFVYFGVEDHPGYHQPSDDFEEITPDFFVDVAEFVRRTVVTFDEQLSDISAATE